MTFELDLATILIIFAAPLPYMVAVAVAVSRYMARLAVWQAEVRKDVDALLPLAGEVRELREQFIKYEAAHRKDLP